MESSNENIDFLPISKKPKSTPNFKQVQLIFNSKVEKNDLKYTNSSKKRKSSETTPSTKLKIDNLGCKRPLTSDKLSNHVIIIDDEEDTEVSSSCELTTKHQMDLVCGQKLTQIDRFFKKQSKPVDVSTSCMNDDLVLILDEEDVANNQVECEMSCGDASSEEKENMDISCEDNENQLEPQLILDELKSELNLNVSNNVKLLKPQLSLSTYKLKRQKQKEEKEKLKTEEKERKEKEKQLLKEKKEVERLEKEREKEEKRIQREEEKKIKQELIEEEKRKKEEARLEEKRRRDEEKKKEEEKLEKKDKISIKEIQLMQNFFKISARDKSEFANPLAETKSASIFRPFELKKDMKLAPSTRYIVEDSLIKINQLDFYILNQDIKYSYLKDLKMGFHLPSKTKKCLERDDEIFMIPEPKLCIMKAKLIQFHDNYRPAYYGTWRKQSSLINGRRPFGRDEKLLDYSVDSDEEWEEEEPGESISHSEGEEETQDENVEEVDGEDDFFVPHGYLSEGEGCADEDDDDLSPEAIKMQQQIKARNWEAEMKSKKIEKLRPICTGIVWYDNEVISIDKTWQEDMLKDFKAGIFDTIYSNDLEAVVESTSIKTAEQVKKNLKPLPEEAMPDLIRLVHGNRYSVVNMIKEFREFLLKKYSPDDISGNVSESSPKMAKQHIVSKRQLQSKIREIASYKKNDSLHRFTLWYVKPEILEKYCLVDLQVPTNWEWITNVNVLTPTETQTPQKNKIANNKPLTPHILSVLRKQTPKRLSLNSNVQINKDSKFVTSQTIDDHQHETKIAADILSVIKKQAPRRIQTVNLTSKSNIDDNISNEKLEINKTEIDVITDPYKTDPPNNILSLFKKKSPRRIHTIHIDDKLELNLDKMNNLTSSCTELSDANHIIPIVKSYTPRKLNGELVADIDTLTIKSDNKNISTMESSSHALSVSKKQIPRRISTVLVDSKFICDINTLPNNITKPNLPAIENLVCNSEDQRPYKLVESKLNPDTDIESIDITLDDSEHIINKNDLKHFNNDKYYNTNCNDKSENSKDNIVLNSIKTEGVFNTNINVEKSNNLNLMPLNADNIMDIDVNIQNNYTNIFNSEINHVSTTTSIEKILSSSYVSSTNDQNLETKILIVDDTFTITETDPLILQSVPTLISICENIYKSLQKKRCNNDDDNIDELENKKN